MQLHLEKSIVSAPFSFIENESIHLHLMHEARKAVHRFSNTFDSRLYQGVERLIVNSSKKFLLTRPFSHLILLLFAQFYLQKKMETSLEKEKLLRHPLFLKLFQRSSRICFAVTFVDFYSFQHEQLLKAIHSLLPGIQKIPDSFFLWHHPDYSYFFCYLEIQKLRGGELAKSYLRKIEKALTEQLMAVPPLTPALFWPYNEEESHRQIQLLLKEISSKEDLPHISIQFQEQTPTSLEFLIYFVRPRASDSISRSLKRLSDSLHFFIHFHTRRKIPFPLDFGAFSLKIPSTNFDVRGSINLLYARRYVAKCLEAVIGPFRDYNGGLFEKQQRHFETLRVHLSDLIPHFDLFAEKVFYALQPVEARLSLSFKTAEDLFFSFSELLQMKGSFIVNNRSENTTIIKTTNISDIHFWSQSCKKAKISHAQLTLGGFHYLCLLGPRSGQIFPLLKKSVLPKKKTKTLRLVFQEGAPPSLNPYHSSGDMRCRILSKLLFEGLTRLNAYRKPEFAGALEVKITKEGRLHTFKLRSNHWSNGEKVTAVDYATSWQCALNDPVSHPEFLFCIKNANQFKEEKNNLKKPGIRAIDAQTLQVELERPDPHFLHKLTQPFYFPIFGSLREPKWFNGPYLIREQNAQELILERNPYFWNASRTFFKQIEIRWEDNVDTIYSLFKEGKVDWIGDPLSTLPFHLVEQFKAEGILQKQRVARRFLVCFNTQHPILSSSMIRRALSSAIDRSFICETIFPESIPLLPLLPAKEEANSLFEKGLQKLGLTREAFPPLKFIYSNHPRRDHLALYLQSVWEKILGITIHLEKDEWNPFRSKLENGNFEICGTIQNHHDDSAEFLERFEGLSSWNFSRWRHLPYRELIKQAKEEGTKQSYKTLLKAKNLLVEEAPFTPLFAYTHLYAHHPRLDKFLITHEGSIDFSWANYKKH